MMGWLSKNFLLKIIALVLAVIIWSYAREELDNTPRYRQEVSRQEVPAETPQR
jgi:hypothetical protein